MVGFDEASLGFGKEGAATYGTYATPTRFLDFLSETLDATKDVKTSPALRMGANSVQRGRGRRVMKRAAGGQTEFEALTKGMGLIWQACLGGTPTHTKVGTTTTYQTVHTIGDLPSYTIQKGLVSENVDGTGTVRALTMLGAVVDNWTLEIPNADDAKLTVQWAGRQMVTNQPYVQPSYAANSNIFTFAGACIFTGALVEPTASALGSMATPLANVSQASVSMSNGLKDARYRMCAQGLPKRPLNGKRVPTGAFTVDYTDNSLVDAVLSDTPMGLMVNLAAVENPDEVLQVVVPEIRLNGDLPKSNGGEPVEQSLTWEGFKAEAASQPIWVVQRTYDTAI